MLNVTCGIKEMTMSPGAFFIVAISLSILNSLKLAAECHVTNICSHVDRLDVA